MVENTSNNNQSSQNSLSTPQNPLTQPLFDLAENLVFAVESSEVLKILPTPIAHAIPGVNILIGVSEDLSTTNEPVSNVIIANVGGALAGGALVTILPYTTFGGIQGLIALGLIASPVGIAVFAAGAALTLTAGALLSDQTHDAILEALRSPGYMEFEANLGDTLLDFKDALFDAAQRANNALHNPSMSLDDLLPFLTPSEEAAFSNYFQDKINDLYLSNILLGQDIQTFLDNLSLAENLPQFRRTDPLSFDLDGDGIELIGLANSKVFFDLDNNDGLREKVGWVASDDGLLALDANRNGIIDNIDELFGGQNADGSILTGTAELKLSDQNGDNVINASDSIFNNLLIWRDLNSNGISENGELTSLASNKIASIELGNLTNSGRIVDGNLIISTGTYTKIDQSKGTIANLDLGIDQTNSVHYQYQDSQGVTHNSYQLKLEALTMPLSRGYGNVESLTIALSRDPQLFTMMENFVNNTNWQNLDSQIEQILYQWAGTSDITGMRGAFDAKRLATMESFRGSAFVNSQTRTNLVGDWQLTATTQAWQSLVLEIKAKLLIQSHLSDILEHPSYDFASDTIQFHNIDKAKLFNNLIEAKASLGDNIKFTYLIYEINQVLPYLMGKISGITTVSDINGLRNDFLSNFGVNPANLINGTNGGDILKGSELADLINAGLGDDIISGFNYGDDIYIYNKGDGKDTIAEFEGASSNSSYGNDKIIFGSGIKANNVYLGKSDNDLTINFFDNNNDQIIIKNQFRSEIDRIETLKFNDATSINIGDLSKVTLKIYGDDGANTLIGHEYNNIIDGKGGDDIINTSGGNDVINGGSGNDKINSSSGNDIINAGLGDDIISGYNYGDDTYLYILGDGKDIIAEYEGASNNSSYGNDKIIFGQDIKASDVYLSKNGNDLTINFFSNNQDQITIKNHFRNVADRIETLEFQDGKIIDVYNLETLIYTIIGDDNDNKITPYYYKDVINAGRGNDIISGFNYGDDIYIYIPGDGKDTIAEYDGASSNSSYGNDKIIFGSGIKANNVYLGKSDNDLTINFFDNNNDQIIIKNQFRSEVDRIETLEFSDNTSINIGDLSKVTLKIYGDDGANTLIGHEYNNIIEGKGGNDIINTSGGNDVINGGSGNDKINSGSGNDIINAGLGDDIIAGFNYGDDIYIYIPGDGKDIIAEYEGASSNSSYGNDTIIFGSGIKATDVYLGKSDNDLTINFFDNNNDQIIIKNQFRSEIDRIETLKFNDATSINIGDLSKVTLKIYGDDSANTLVGHEYNNIIDGKDGDDIINTSGGNDVINGGSGNDKINSSSGNDIINAGLGDDIISGYNYGDDIYIYIPGDGKDSIAEYADANGSNSSYGNDKIVFGQDIKATDVYLSKNGNDLTINFFSNNQDQITIKNHFRNVADRIETLEFQDGKIIDVYNLETVIYTIIGDDNDNKITPYYYKDVINAGRGNDIISGYNYGDDTYIYIPGDGKDSIAEYADVNGANSSYGNDKILFGATIAKEDVYLSQNGSNLIISFLSTNDDKITIINHFRSEVDKVEALQFSDGSIISLSDYSKIPYLLMGNDNDNIIVPSQFNETINPGKGNDIVSGNNYGDDTYIYNKGDGKDIITEYEGAASNSSYGNDKILFGSQIKASDVYLGKNNNDLTINFIGNDQDKITITNYFRSQIDRIETLQFQDNTTIDISDVTKITVQIYGDDTNNILIGHQYKNIIDSKSGDDTITTYSGDDIINGGDGNDTINPGTGKNIITGGVGNDIISGNLSGDDTYIYNKGDGKDIISEYQGTNGNDSNIYGNDKIVFGSDIKIDDIYFGKKDNNLTINFISNNQDQITINNHFRSAIDRVETLQFQENATINLTDLSKVTLKIDGDNAANILSGHAYNNIIDGKNGNDIITSYNGADVINGGGGNDVISSGGGDDIINAGNGDDIISDYNLGNDIYIYNKGNGKDIITEYKDLQNGNNNAGYGGFDEIRFGAEITKEDVYLTQNKQDLIINFANSSTDRITISNYFRSIADKIEKLSFANGDTIDLRIPSDINFTINGDAIDNYINGTIGKDTILGNDGNDEILAGESNDTIIGGHGYDLMVGGVGNDIYVYNIGDGKDIINERDFSRGTDNQTDLGNDIIKFGDNISRTSIALYRSSSDLVIKFVGNDNDQIIVKNHFSGLSSRIESLVFSDGSNIDLVTNPPTIPNLDIITTTITGSANADNLEGTNADNIINAFGGNDVINGNGGDDIINASNGNDTINGGTGRDLLSGNTGDDIYLFNVGDGKDIITETGIYDNYGTASGNYGIDKIVFGTGFSKSDIYFSKLNNDLIINFKNNASDQITIRNYTNGDPINLVESFEFADGSVINSSAANLLTYQINGDNNDNIITPYYYNDIIKADKGDDIISGYNYGDDSYLYNKGDGKDIITEFEGINGYGSYGNDKIIFGIDIDKKDVYLSKSDNNLVINFKNSNADQIIITNHFRTEADKIEQLQFSDSSVIELSDYSKIPYQFIGDNSNNKITPGFYDDIINAGRGDDLISAFNYGNDTYIYTLGDGKDIIVEFESPTGTSSSYGNDKISFGTDINSSDVYLGKKDNDLTINFVANNNDQITIQNYFRSQADIIEILEFQDGTIINISDVTKITVKIDGDDGANTITGHNYKNIIDGKGGNDVITTYGENDIILGGIGNDKINSGSGNDTINGGAGDDIISDYNSGNDSYLYNKGDGKDIITEFEGINGYDSPYGNDKIIFGSDIKSGDVYLGKKDNDLIVNFANNSNDQITIKNQFRTQADRIEILEFNDSVTINIGDLSKVTLKIDGDDGANNLTGHQFNNIIDGKNGNDIITTYGGNDIILGGSGNDKINSGTGNDIITGGTGDDIISGYNYDNDTYIYNKGDGKDIINEFEGINGYGNSYGNDKIIFGSDIDKQDVYLSKSDNNLVINFKNSNLDQITITNHFRSEADKIEQLQFSDSSVIELSDYSKIPYQFIGDDSNNKITPNFYNDIINAGRGDDLISALNYGNDTYIFKLGDGKDVISEFDNPNGNDSSYGNDKIIFDADINSSDFYLGKKDNDLIINFVNNSSDQITLKNHFRSQADRIETLEFNNGTSVNIGDLSKVTVKIDGDDGANTITGHQFNNIIDGKNGNDIITTYGGNDIIFGGSGNDKINSGSGNDTINGGTGDDIISGYNEGNDTYIYNKGDGKDIITEFEGINGYDSSYGNDKIIFGTDIKSGDVYLGKKDNDLIINFANNSNDQITIKNQFRTQADRIEILEFNDGVTINIGDLSKVTLKIDGDDGANNLTGHQFNNIIDGKNGNDIITTYGGNDIILGGSGNDKINSGTGNDTINGGTGDDIISGYNEGNDSYIFNKGDGKDIITEFEGINGYGNSYGNDKIIFGSDIDKQDVYLSKNDNNLVINFKNSKEDQIIITNHFRTEADKIEQLQFSDNSVIELSDYSKIPYQFIGDDSNNKITPNFYNDIINAGRGDDIISALNYGNDTYIFKLGDGKDVISEFDNPNGNDSSYGNDKISFGKGINSRDFYLGKKDNDLIINFVNNSSDQITLKNHFRSEADRIETLEFQDGTSFNIGDLSKVTIKIDGDDGANTITGHIFNNIIDGKNGNDIITTYGGNDIIFGGSGNDKINSGSGNDTINGGTGDDIISGYNEGNDTYIYNKGNGKDIITEFESPNAYNGSYGNDQILFGSDVKKEHLYFARQNNDLIIKFINNNSENDRITISNQFRDQADRIETLKFADNSTIDISDISKISFNTPPRAGSPFFSLDENSSIVVDVLSFASDTDNNPLTIISANAASHGIVEIVQGSGGKTQLKYTPNTNFHGVDSFTYQISDGNGGFAQGTANVTIDSINHFPTIPTLMQLQAIEDQNSVLDILAQVSDMDNDPLQIITVGTLQHGNVAIFSDIDGKQKLLYTPNPDFSGQEQLSYTISDDHNNVIQGKAIISVAAVNDAPTLSGNINVTISEDNNISINAIASVHDIDGDKLSIGQLGVASHGTTSIVTNNEGQQRILYIPDANFYGDDSFTYEILDNHGGAVTGTASLHVTSVNDAPQVSTNAVLSLQVLENTEFSYHLPANLINDIDGDNIHFALAADSPSWVSFDETSNSLKFNPLIGDTGIRHFAVNASDGNDSVMLNFTINIAAYRPTAGNDIARGNDIANRILGNGGNDQIWGGGGNDILFGGTGNDILNGETGDDILMGDSGNDNLIGAIGADTLNGGSGDDLLNGSDGNDILMGDSGNDTLIGGFGSDILSGGDGSDLFSFQNLGDSNNTTMDLITDFELGIDKIDLSSLDINYSDIVHENTGSSLIVHANGLTFELQGDFVQGQVVDESDYLL